MIELISKTNRTYSFPTRSGLVRLAAGASLVVTKEQYEDISENEGFDILAGQAEIVVNITDDSVSTTSPESIPENDNTSPKRTKG